MKLDNSLNQIIYKDMVQFYDYTPFALSPKLLITYEDGFNDYLYSKNIEVQIYKYIDLDQL